MGAALRPGFSVDLACPSKLLLERLFARLGAGPYQLRRTRAFGSEREATVRERENFILTVAEPEQHLWSPWLNIEVTPRGDGAHLFARFSPHPSVWTCFAATYLLLSTVFFLSLCISASLVMSGSAPWALGVSGAAVVVMIGLWGASQLGQRWAHEQMTQLRAELERATEASLAPAPATEDGAS